MFDVIRSAKIINSKQITTQTYANNDYTMM